MTVGIVCSSVSSRHCDSTLFHHPWNIHCSELPQWTFFTWPPTIITSLPHTRAVNEELSSLHVQLPTRGGSCYEQHTRRLHQISQFSNIKTVMNARGSLQSRLSHISSLDSLTTLIWYHAQTIKTACIWAKKHSHLRVFLLSACIERIAIPRCLHTCADSS